MNHFFPSTKQSGKGSRQTSYVTHERKPIIFLRSRPPIHFYIYTRILYYIEKHTHKYICFLNIELQKQNMPHFFETWPDLHETPFSVFRDRTNSPYRDYKSGRVHFGKGPHAKGLPGYVCTCDGVWCRVCLFPGYRLRKNSGKLTGQ